MSLHRGLVQALGTENTQEVEKLIGHHNDAEAAIWLLSYINPKLARFDELQAQLSSLKAAYETAKTAAAAEPDLPDFKSAAQAAAGDFFQIKSKVEGLEKTALRYRQLQDELKKISELDADAILGRVVGHL